ncbi:MAG: D-Ala-D-Ala carboxypeptidase family metallohydrolase, partial [Gemmatimonadota bacterium]|nr:D-Ala-D-Ala carboxypeptidase family metallohydrolase [Gemmatimonadota bacterium]
MRKFGTLASALAAALAVLGFYRPPRNLLIAPFSNGLFADSTMASVAPSRAAFGRSGAVRVQFALPGELVRYPLDVPADTIGLRYEWVALDGMTPIDSAHRSDTTGFTAPGHPGLYQLGISRNGEHRVLEAITVAVMVPFEEKQGGKLDGYRLGMFMAEKKNHAGHERPDGFVRITEAVAELPITKHLRLGDFLSRQEQAAWPRYAAMNGRVLDKVELVVAKLAMWRGDTLRPQTLLSVHSGFRAPVFNRTVRRAAKDSRHQYGDAMDVAIDADGDGKLTLKDARIVALAVDAVEQDFPELVGGMGLYTSRRYP